MEGYEQAAEDSLLLCPEFLLQADEIPCFHRSCCAATTLKDVGNIGHLAFSPARQTMKSLQSSLFRRRIVRARLAAPPASPRTSSLGTHASRRSTNGLAGKQCDTTAIDAPRRADLGRQASSTWSWVCAPRQICDAGREARQGMQVHRAEIAMPPPQSGFHHEVESDLIERLAAEAIVEPAQGYGGLIILAPERSSRS
jgi:hypothetical protein